MEIESLPMDIPDLIEGWTSPLSRSGDSIHVRDRNLGPGIG